MDAPNLDIGVEPVVGEKAVYLRLAPATPGAIAEIKLVLALKITNEEDEAVTVTGIRYAFPGSGLEAVDHVLPENNFNEGPEIAPGAKNAKWWSNGVVKGDPEKRSNVIYRPLPAPAQVRVEVTCQDFTHPATVTLPLAAHVPDVAGGGYHFPICTSDLADDERLVTSALHRTNGGPTGTQIFSHDLDVRRWDAATGTWTAQRANPTGDVDADACGWDVPIRAMADGIVAKDPVDGHDDTLPSGGSVPGTGNHVWITHGSERMKYAHLRKGSIPPELREGTRVYAGQVIGRMGSSGNASGPHIHMECVSDNRRRLRPIVLRSAWVADATTVSAPGEGGDWVALNGAGVPRHESAIWPGSTTPSFRIPAIGIARSGDWDSTTWISPSYEHFVAKADELREERGHELSWVSTYLVDGRVRFFGIARDGVESTLFRSEGYGDFSDEATRLHMEEGRRLICAATYLEGGKRYFVGISREGTWRNRLFRRDGYIAFRDEAERLQLEDGRRLSFVTTYLEGGTRRFVGIAASGDWSKTLFRRVGYTAFRDEATRLHLDEGQRLVCAAVYHEAGKNRYIGIARSGGWGNTLYQSGDLDSFRLYAERLHAEKGRRLTCAAFYDTA